MERSRFAFIADWVDMIVHWDRGKGDADAAAERALASPPEDRMRAACAVLMGRIGDASQVAVAGQALSAYEDLDAEGRLAFFRLLRDDYGVEAEAIETAYEAWREEPDATHAAELFRVTEPKRQTLLRRLNLAPEATAKLVKMRADLLGAIREDPSLRPVDADFSHLLTSWFNRGFLGMRRIDWNTPAAILEKIIRYESVHAMEGWADLRRRLSDKDRRLYAFFHPALPEEPLIFVEVALTRGVPDAIRSILTEPEPADPVEADTAVFYSINNSLKGLKGISFGNFLIKQVVASSAEEIPGLKTFVTLSPAPTFAAWLNAQKEPRCVELAAALRARTWLEDSDLVQSLRPEVEAVAARYFVTARDAKGRPPDPVARFHLGNGASAWRINWPGDLSERALERAHGLMINYLYEPAAIEAQHEAFVRDGVVAHGPLLADALER